MRAGTMDCSETVWCRHALRHQARSPMARCTRLHLPQILGPLYLLRNMSRGASILAWALRFALCGELFQPFHMIKCGPCLTCVCASSLVPGRLACLSRSPS